LIPEITPETMEMIRNPRFKSHAAICQELQKDFISSVRAAGLALDSQEDREQMSAHRTRLADNGAVVRNDGRSVEVNWIFPCCIAFQTGLGMETLFLSLKCQWEEVRTGFTISLPTCLVRHWRSNDLAGPRRLPGRDSIARRTAIRRLG
jgi:hypothetical protein